MLNDFTLWQEVFTGSYSATENSCYKVPIPEIFLPLTNVRRILSVGCFSHTSLGISAGWIYQILQLPFKPHYFYSQKCLLDKYNLVILPDIAEFKISFSPDYRLKDLTLIVSQYMGSIENLDLSSINFKLEQISSDLTGIKNLIGE